MWYESIDRRPAALRVRRNSPLKEVILSCVSREENGGLFKALLFRLGLCTGR